MRIESDSHHNLSTPVFGMDLKKGNRPISSLLVYHRFLFSFLPCLSDSFPYSPPYSNMPSRWCFEREVNDGTKECIIDIRLLKQSFDTLNCKHQWLKNPHIKIRRRNWRCLRYDGGSGGVPLKSCMTVEYRWRLRKSFIGRMCSQPSFMGRNAWQLESK